MKDAVVGEENITSLICLGLSICKEMKSETTRARNVPNVDFTQATSNFFSYLFTEMANSLTYKKNHTAVTRRVRLMGLQGVASWLGGVISWNPPGANLTSLWQCFRFHQTNIRVLTF